MRTGYIFAVLVLNVFCLSGVICKRLCADPNCTTPISYAQSVIKFHSDHPEKLSYQAKEALTIFSKNVPEDKNGLWEAEIKSTGKRGLINPNTVREFKVFKKAIYTVDDDPKEEEAKTENEDVAESVKAQPGGVAAEFGDGGHPSPVLVTHDGTIFTLGTDGDVILPSVVEEPSLKTTTPPTVPPESISKAEESATSEKIPVAAEVSDEEEVEEEDDGDDDEEDDEEDEDEAEEEEESSEVSAAVDEKTEAPPPDPSSVLQNLFASIDEALSSEPGRSPEIDGAILANSRVKRDAFQSNSIPLTSPDSPPLLFGNVQQPTQDRLLSPEPIAITDEVKIVSSIESPAERYISGTAPLPHVVPTSILPVLQPPAYSVNSEPVISPLFVGVQDTHVPVQEPTPPETPITPSFAQQHEATESVLLSDATPYSYHHPTPSPLLVPQESVVNYIENSPKPFASPVDEINTYSREEVIPVDHVPSIGDVPIPQMVSPPPPIYSNNENLQKDETLHVTSDNALDHDSSQFNVSYDMGNPELEQSPLPDPVETLPTTTPETMIPYVYSAMNTNPIEDSPSEKIDEVVADEPTEGSVSEPDVHLESPTESTNVVDEVPVTEETGSGIFSGMSGVISNLFGSGEKEEEPPREINVETVVEKGPEQSDSILSASATLEEVIPEISETEHKHVVPEGECKSISGLESDCADAPSPAHLWEYFENKTIASSNAFLYLIVTAVTVLIFTLGYYFIEQTRQDRPLIAKVNQLTHDLQVATSQLEARSLQDSQILSEGNNEILASLNCELEDLRKVKGELELQLEAQQQELEAATEAGLELNRMLSDLLTQKEGSDHLLQSVEQLQGQLDSQQKIIDEMNRSLLEKSAENQNLATELAAAHEKVEALDEELNDMRQNLNVHLKEKEEITNELEARNTKLEAEFTTLTKLRSADVSALENSISDLSQQLSIRDSEFMALKLTIEELRDNENIDTSALYDVGHTKAELLRIQSEKESLQERLGDEEGARKLLEDHVKSVDSEVAKLRSSCEAAEKEKVEAETRLTVLSNYFKEKETQLQKELGLQEALWALKQGDDSTVYEKIKSLQEEVENYNFDSFPNSNEGISISTSMSSVTNEPCTSLPNLSVTGIKKTDSLRSLPTATKSRRVLSRRRSSAEFEARLERAELMISKRDQITRQPLPEDLLMLQQMKTVWASPFREPADENEAVAGDQEKINNNDVITFNCSEMISRFESYNKQPKLINIVEQVKHETPIMQIPSTAETFFKKLDENVGVPHMKDFPTEPIKTENIIEEDNTESCVSYNLRKESFEDLNNIDSCKSLVPVPAPRISHSPAKSESDDSQSLGKDCELESSATVKFDIKVVANATSNVKKLKKSSRQKVGSQNDTLKKEILDQERGLKGQIASLEKKAHENWVAARQAERRLEESKQEAGQLRNMLTLIEKSVNDPESKQTGRHPGDLNGEDSLPPLLNDGTSPLPPFPTLPLDPLAPPPMLPPGFMPPPHFIPGGFMPPPPPPPYLTGDRRPPPLGRMSSPPLNSRYSPSPGEFDFDRMSPSIQHPSRNYRSPPVDGDRFRHRTPHSPSWEDMPSRGFRPVNSQRDMRRDYQGSSNLSSGHSSTDSLDKSNSRHGGKV